MPATATEQGHLDALEAACMRYYRAEMALLRAKTLLTHHLTYQPKAADIIAMLAEIDRALSSPSEAADRASEAA